MVTLSSTAANAAAISQQQAFDPFAAASGAVLNLVACCCLGVTASRYRVLDQQALSALSRLVYNVFQPSLLFTNVLQILATPSQARGTIFLLPLAAAVQIVTAAGISRVLLRLVGLNPFSEAGREVRICSTFANAGPLPLLFVDALFKNHPDPTLRTRAVAFISFYLLAWSPLFWNYGYGILVDKTEDTGGKKGQPMEYSSLGTQSVGGLRLGSGTGGAGMMVNGNGSAAAMVLEEGVDGKETHATNWTSPHQQQYSRQQVPCSEGRSYPSHALVRSALEKARRVAHSRAMKKLLNPPTLGCTLGALVGVCSPLRGLLFGDTAPFSCVFSALRTMGSAYVPCVLLILSGSLAQGLEGFDSNVFRRAMLVMFQRFCIMPAVAFACVETGKRTGLLPTQDPLLLFVILLQGCMPSAQNSVLILQLERRPQAAASIARLISTVYILSILPVGMLIRTLLSYCPMGFTA